MNLKKISLSLASTCLILGSAFTVIGQTSANDSSRYLPPIIDFILNSQTSCSAPVPLTVLTATDDGGFRNAPGDFNPPSNAIDGLVSTRWAHNNGDDVSGSQAIITFALEATAAVTDLSASWLNSHTRDSFFSIETSTDNTTWVPVLTNGRTARTTASGDFQTHDVEDSSANFVRLIGNGNTQTNNNFTSINEVIINGCVGVVPSSSSSSSSSSSGGPDSVFGLDPALQPWENFDLSVWGLDSPALREINANSSSDNFERGVRIDDFHFIALSEGQPGQSSYDNAEALFTGESSNIESSAPYFFTADDGGMVFKSPIGGGRTSTNTSFPRSELREYTRGGILERANGQNISVTGSNENNWVLGYQPAALALADNKNLRDIPNVGGRNGVLKATLRVNQVTETGAPDDIGVTIIGQIHAEDDEPLRLYYRKLPGNALGSVYFVHEIREARSSDVPQDPTGRDGDDLDEFVLVGSRSDNAPNPVGGIALDELFSYEIIAQGSVITVILIRGDADGEEIDRDSIDMATVVNDGITGSGYDRADESMYFKAGAYTQNNTGLDDDYDQVTFYRLSVSHDENDCSSCFNTTDP